MTPVEQKIRELLTEVYTDAGVQTWLRTPNTLLEDRVPAEVMATPDGAELVLAVVRHLRGGGF